MSQFVPLRLEIRVYQETARRDNVTWEVAGQLDISGNVRTAVGNFEGFVQLTPEERDAAADLMERIVDRIDRELNA